MNQTSDTSGVGPQHERQKGWRSDRLGHPFDSLPVIHSMYASSVNVFDKDLFILAFLIDSDPCFACEIALGTQNLVLPHIHLQ